MAEDWLNKIRESQADFSEPEPEGLWAGIEAGLAAEDVGTSAGRTSREDSAVSRRRTVRWWWAALPAAAVAALVLFLSVPGHRDASDDPLMNSAVAELKSTAEPFDVVPQSVECLRACYFVRIEPIYVQLCGTVFHVLHYVAVPYLVEESVHDVECDNVSYWLLGIGLLLTHGGYK